MKLLVLLAPALTFAGCRDLGILDPKGQVGMHELTLMTICVGIMLCIVLPVIVATIYFSYKYRATNRQAEYKPEWAHSNTIEFFVWGVPITVIFCLAILTYIYCHKVDPYRPLETTYQGAPIEKTLTIQVVALDWKWLFIYPDENIATINEVYLPVNSEVTFKITSDTGMNSFFIPKLGSQVYAMGGMETQLHLDAFEPGVFNGQASNYSGHGHSFNQFQVHAVSDAEYQVWLKKVRQEGQVLDKDVVHEIAFDQKIQREWNRQTVWVANPATFEKYYRKPRYFSAVKPINMFYETFINKYAGMTLRDREMKKLMDELCKVGV